METVAIVLSVGEDRVDEFEQGFREHELPVWQDLSGRGVLVRASLSRLAITFQRTPDATEYLVIAVFADSEGHHQHDSHPGFQAWNTLADAYQVREPLAFGGETILRVDA
ncbi:MAG: hypothetical protein E6J39_07520 [Chloroflexi bacterium]|nr:MAG: hypothetical protein E6J39_07520 [Chloroflexota bacterium]